MYSLAHSPQNVSPRQWHVIIVPFRPGALPLRYAVIGYRKGTRTPTSRNGFIRGVAAATSRGCAVPPQGGQKAADRGLAANQWNDKECRDIAAALPLSYGRIVWRPVGFEPTPFRVM